MSIKSRGFTIVELLIVIVVIAILAAISIVAYNGIQARGRTSSAQSTAAAVAKKAELYNTIVGNYPIAFGNMTGAASTEPYKLTGVTSTASSLTNTTPEATIYYNVCGTGSPASLTAITTANVSGGQAIYRKYDESINSSTTAGIITGSGVLCYNSAGAAT